jgi:acyl-coenzyme A thioesterase PaaI-like protein
MTQPTSQPDLSPEPDWTPCKPFGPEASQGSTFVSSDTSGRFNVRYFAGDDGALVGKAWLGQDCQGPPGHAHGGSLASLLDEAMGAAAWSKGHRVVAAKLEIAFKAPVPLDTAVRFEAWIAEINGRKLTTRSRLFVADTLCCEGEALFVTAPALLDRKTP